jgi:glycosyltransferase involved in cell wall biosynthesis
MPTAVDRSVQGVGRVPVAVIVATKNESLHIARCLSSVSWAAERFVVDSYSSDDTLEVARASGAETVQHGWTGYSAQKNWAMVSLPIRSPWILFLDADEVVSVELADDIRKVTCEEAASRSAFYVARRLVFLGHEMRHAWWYPDYAIRLVKRGTAHFDERTVHERLVVNQPAGVLKGYLLHENRKPLHDFIERHNYYSSREAYEALRKSKVGPRSDFASALTGDAGQRRRALRDRVWARLPLLTRPAIRFCYIYLWRRGFLDGKAGLWFALLIGSYEMNIDAKIYELRMADGHGWPHPLLTEVRRELADSAAGDGSAPS